MAKVSKCISCGATRIMKKGDLCKRCNRHGSEFEEEEVSTE